ncbi:arginine--tRNA ligase [Hyphobacterium marinum]|uniref:Arginine--tRNA ligase n=1 Tax=Hyphobacterium marinum TaxID=3116574 RepID=A0ABU7LWY1_9PROT|nr:arginine--tRNA ligase [Hyphobacterium sp. Y6023]MEE2566030.1 arginine--tRNA ligase [Hyphobacterium sp. Y6023]
MTAIAEQLTQRLGAAFEALGLPPELGRTIESDRPDLAPYQCNGAMAAARLARKAPRAVAEDVAAQLSGDPLLAAVEIAGPGFLNLTPRDAVYDARAGELGGDDRTGARTVETARKIMIDFGGPNVAKPMHVGHLRSSIIGDCLQRLFRFRGDSVTSDVHLGDWGLQMGQLITEVELVMPDLPYFDIDFEGPYPSKSPVTMDDLQTLYPQASAACKQDKARLESARAATRALQSGRPGYVALWRHFLEVSKEALRQDFDALGVRFDLWKGEADVDPLIPDMVADLKSRGVAVEDQGALVIHVNREDEKRELPPFLLLKSDGAALYETTDLATILDRKAHTGPDLTLYVVDKRQSDHFEKVFRAALLAGYAEPGALEHIAYGTMNGWDGKPFKTREGGVLKLADLLRMATDKARARLDEAGLGQEGDASERESVASKVALAAIKFADLSHDRATDYIFDLDRFMSFEGKTGPYLLYAAVRIKSLMRKAAEAGVSSGAVQVSANEERELIRVLDAFDRAVTDAYERRAPNALCDHVFTLAQAFSKFYGACPILPEKDEAVKASRLALAEMTLKQLELAFSLIGIEAPERM